MEYKIKRLKGTSYDCHCRGCNFSRSGETRNIITQAKKHFKKTGHEVEYYIENGKVIKPNP